VLWEKWIQTQIRTHFFLYHKKIKTQLYSNWNTHTERESEGKKKWKKKETKEKNKKKKDEKDDVKPRKKETKTNSDFQGLLGNALDSSNTWEALSSHISLSPDNLFPGYFASVHCSLCCQNEQRTENDC